MELSTELIKSLKENNSFRLFQNYILEKIDSLNTVDGLEELANEQAGETAKVRSLAIATLREILDPIMNFRARLEPGVDEIQQKKDKYGL